MVEQGSIYLPSKKSVTKAGNVLLGKIEGDKSQALEVVSSWRLAHAIPMHTLGDYFRRRVRDYYPAIVARRLKRLPTILDKLQRFPNMALHRMQDIGGIRVILKNVKDVYSLYNDATRSSRFRHQLLLPPDDYIERPKDDGYRGIHQVVKYHSTDHPELEGLQIEIQFRTQLQHNWATAVETYGILAKDPYKSWEQESERKRFFQLVSTAFAKLEKQNLHPDFSAISNKQLIEEIKNLDNTYAIIKKFETTIIASNKIQTANKGDSDYQLIKLDFDKETISVFTFTEGQLSEAGDLYRDIEAKNDPHIDAVLISVGELKKIRRAYPNYFLNGKEFVKDYKKILDIKNLG